MDTIKKSLKAADVMTREVLTFREETTVREAATALIEKRISGAPVVDKAGRIAGVLSEEDLIGVYYEGHRDLERQPIGTCSVLGSSLVTRKVVTVKAETALHDVAKKLMGLKIKRVPVVDAEGKLVGVVSRKDILRALVDPLQASGPVLAPPPAPKA